MIQLTEKTWAQVVSLGESLPLKFFLSCYRIEKYGRNVGEKWENKSWRFKWLKWWKPPAAASAHSILRNTRTAAVAQQRCPKGRFAGGTYSIGALGEIGPWGHEAMKPWSLKKRQSPDESGQGPGSLARLAWPRITRNPAEPHLFINIHRLALEASREVRKLAGLG